MEGMSELEKLEAGLEYRFDDPEVAGYKNAALAKCRRLNAIDPADTVAQTAAIRDLFGSVGRNPSTQPYFNCDFGIHIHAGDNFLTNYNVTILDVATVTIGDDVLIGPNTIVTTVGHPISPEGRRQRLGVCRPVTIGNDVWIGGNCTILPGVTIGDGAVVGAGAVVTHDVPPRTVVAGVPARVIGSVDRD